MNSPNCRKASSSGIFPAYIFYTEKNHSGNLQNVMVLVLETGDERHHDHHRAARHD